MLDLQCYRPKVTFAIHIFCRLFVKITPRISDCHYFTVGSRIFNKKKLDPAPNSFAQNDAFPQRYVKSSWTFFMFLKVTLFLRYKCNLTNWILIQHMLNMKLNLQSLFGHHVYSCTHWPRPPPRIWAQIRGRYWSAKINDVSLWPWYPATLYILCRSMRIQSRIANNDYSCI